MNRRDVKVTVATAVSTALAFVAVYEGKVAVSHAGQSVQLVAGEGAKLSAGGPRRENDGHEIPLGQIRYPISNGNATKVQVTCRAAVEQRARQVRNRSRMGNEQLACLR